MDASQLYVRSARQLLPALSFHSLLLQGSSDARARELRTFVGGRLNSTGAQRTVVL
jgi:predicted ATPase